VAFPSSGLGSSPRPTRWGTAPRRLGGLLRATAADIDVARAALRAAPAECAYARVDLVQTDNGPVVMELELVEPALFLDEATGAVDRFARHLAAL
jgi:hypothetical protein